MTQLHGGAREDEGLIGLEKQSKMNACQRENEGTLFAGILFVLAGFEPTTESQFAAALEQHGALNVGRCDARCTHVIVSQLLYDDPVCATARKDGKVLVTDTWVADSLDLGVLPDVNNVLYRPLHEPDGIPGTRGLVICLTGYQGQSRRDVMRMVEMIGAQFTKPLIAATVTHLICYKFEGEKYRLAKQLGVKLVNHKWLEDCLKEWALLPEERYSKSGWELELLDAKANDSDDGTESNKVHSIPGTVADQSLSSLGLSKGFEGMVVHASVWARHSPGGKHIEEEKISRSCQLRPVPNENTLKRDAGMGSIMEGGRQDNQKWCVDENLLLNLAEMGEDATSQLGKDQDGMEGSRKESIIKDGKDIYSTTKEKHQIEQDRHKSSEKTPPDIHGTCSTGKEDVFLTNCHQQNALCSLLVHTDSVEKHQGIGMVSEGNVNLNEVPDLSGRNMPKVHECPLIEKVVDASELSNEANNLTGNKVRTPRTGDVGVTDKKKHLPNVENIEVIEKGCERATEASASLKEVALVNSKLELDKGFSKSQERNCSKIKSVSTKSCCKAASTSRKGGNQVDLKVSDTLNSDKENCFATDGNVAVKSCNLSCKGSVAKLLGGATVTISNDALLSSSTVVKKENQPKLQERSNEMVFALSGHRHERKNSQDIIKKLGGRICRDSHHWCNKTTHLIIPAAAKRTEKFFAAASAGRWILKADYLEASYESGRFLDEEAFELQGPGMNEDASISLEAARKWRLHFKLTGCGAFHGLRVVVYGECIIPPLDTLKRAIKAGGGNILATAPPYSRLLFAGGIDFAIVSPGTPRDDEWVQAFLSEGVACVTTDFFVDYVCKPSAPFDRHVLYDTNSAVAKTLERLQKNIHSATDDHSKLKDISSKDGNVCGSVGGLKGIDGGDEIACCKCGKIDREDVMLLCGDGEGHGCGVAVHIDCCNPPLKEVPVDDWFCWTCTKPPALKKTKRRKRQ